MDFYFRKANIDVQFIGEKTQVITSYVTKYATKGEKLNTAQLWDLVQKSSKAKTRIGQIKSLVHRIFRSREVGMY